MWSLIQEHIRQHGDSLLYPPTYTNSARGRGSTHMPALDVTFLILIVQRRKGAKTTKATQFHIFKHDAIAPQFREIYDAIETYLKVLNEDNATSQSPSEAKSYH